MHENIYISLLSNKNISESLYQMAINLETNLEREKEFTWLYEHMSNFELFEEFCAYKNEDDKKEKSYGVLIEELKKRDKEWIKDLCKTSKKDISFYLTLNKRGIEPNFGNIFSLKNAIQDVFNYNSLSAGTIKVRLKNGMEQEMGYFETLNDCKPERIREFSRKRYSHGEEIYKKLLK